MTSRPLVSVVTPTLNQARYIGFTFHSVAGQTYAPIEHIIVDGGSTDGTIDLLTEWESSARLSWISEPDRGMYDAVNKGIGLARGEIVAYLNSDDVYLPWTIQTVVDYFAKHPDVGVVYGDYVSMDEETGKSTLLLQPPYDVGYITRTGFIPQPTAFWRRSVHEALGGFDPALQFVGDCDFWIRAGKICRVEKIDEVLAIDRLQQGAKRSLNQAALKRELELVRRRHEPVARNVPQLLDRVYAVGWRRVQLARFLAAAARGGDRHRPWSRILRAHRITVRPLRLLLAVVPRVGARYLSTAVEIRWGAFRPRVSGEHAASGGEGR